MKKRLAVIFIIILCFLFLCLYIERVLVVNQVKSVLNKPFPGSRISIGQCRLQPFSGKIKLKNISVERSSFYSLRIKELIAGFSLRRLFFKRGVIYPEYIKLNIEKFDFQGFMVRSLAIEAFQGKDRQGEFSAASFNKDKIKINNFKAKTYLDKEKLYFKDLAADFLGGVIEGKAVVSLSSDFEIFFEAEMRDLDLEKATQEFDFEEKASLEGKIGGKFIAKSSAQGVKNIDGKLLIQDPGGVLTIQDKSFLENISRSSRIPLDILVESFKNYRYNIGNIELFLDNGNLNFNVALDGEAGKRNLNIVVHAFNLKRR